MQEEAAIDALVKAAVTAERKRIASKARDRAESFKTGGLMRGLIAALALNSFANDLDPETARNLKITLSNNPFQP